MLILQETGMLVTIKLKFPSHACFMDLKTLNKAFRNTHFMCHILCEMAFSHFELKLLPKAWKEAEKL